MMSLYKSRLFGRLSKVQALALAGELSHDGRAVSDMCTLMLQENEGRVSDNAAWVLTHLPAAEKLLHLYPRYDELVDFAISPDIHIRRGLVFSILLDMPVGEEPRTDLLDFCMEHLCDQRESPSTRANLIKCAIRLCCPYPELTKELCLCLDMLPPDSPPSIACAKRDALRIAAQNSGGSGI